MQKTVKPATITNIVHELYLDSLSPKELKAYVIAKEHLGMTFDLEKCTGFKQWREKYTK